MLNAVWCSIRQSSHNRKTLWLRQQYYYRKPLSDGWWSYAYHSFLKNSFFLLSRPLLLLLLLLLLLSIFQLRNLNYFSIFDWKIFLKYEIFAKFFIWYFQLKNFFTCIKFSPNLLYRIFISESFSQL